MIGDGDIENLMSNGDWDTAASITQSDGITPVADIQGIFTDATQQSALLTNETETVNPMFDAPSSVITANGIIKGYIATINGLDYKIERVQVNGTGVTTLHLKTQ